MENQAANSGPAFSDQPTFELSHARNFILAHTPLEGFNEELNDIIDCPIKQVVQQISLADFELMAAFVPMPRTRNHMINLRRARPMVEEQLVIHPTFRSTNPSKVVLSIITYYKTFNKVAPRQPQSPSSPVRKTLEQGKTRNLSRILQNTIQTSNQLLEEEDNPPNNQREENGQWML